MATTTFFALTLLLTGKEGAVSFEAEGTTRQALEPALAEEAGHRGLCWYVDTSRAERPRWVCSGPDAEAAVPASDVPPQVREAGARWLGTRTGRECAEEWHREEPAAIEAGTEFGEWCRRSPLPAEGDCEYFVRQMQSLNGRRPTEPEVANFRAALLSHLWDLSPVSEAA